jgi:hypothetical protein
MASQAKVMGTVTNSVRFMIERLQSQIVEKSVPTDLNLNEFQVKEIVSLVQSSLEDSYNRTMNQIINAIDE